MTTRKMLSKSVKFLSLLAAALTLGCASGPPFEPVTAIPPEKALIYVYRPPVFHGAAFSPGITINGKSVVALTSGGYVPYFADPGQVKVEITNVGTRSIDFTAKGGGTYYVKGGTVFMGLGVPSIEFMPAEIGAAEIKECKRLTQ